MRRLLLIGFLLTLVLVGCSGESVANDMYEHLEETVELERTFVEQQEPFTALEEEEQELYNQIIELTADEMDEITSLSEQAIDTIEERKELLQTELESMQGAEEEFSQVKEYVDELDEEPKEIAEEMIQTMDQRYEVYQQLNEAYLSSLDQDKILYELFMDEELTEEELREQIDTVNQSYDEVMEINTEFNELTDTYNQLKEDFYKAADLNVVYE
ncbi:YkyA family protein [Gracilibacillus lacisalsi]|uniref:YkyA family protein n=1 Tax=Gracilibacillus lacisalsi TaxID=393087 RepID=UPI00036F4DB0|nr:YkyA family protein [Gracilibacillus lacisalsi]